MVVNGTILIPTHTHKYRVYYADGSIYSGDPAKAPVFGVLAIVEFDKIAGRRIVSRSDYYCLDDRGEGLSWFEADYIGFIDYLATPGYKRVLFGRLVSNKTFDEIYQHALTDPDFPPKTSPVLRHNNRKA